MHDERKIVARMYKLAGRAFAQVEAAPGSERIEERNGKRKMKEEFMKKWKY